MSAEVRFTLDGLLFERELPALGAPHPDLDPLARDDVLQESQVVDVRMHALTGTIGVLLDLRQSLHFVGRDTGLLIGWGVRACTWTAPARDTALTAWSIFPSVPARSGEGFSLTIEAWESAELVVRSAEAAFITGNVVGISAVPPDYTEVEPASRILDVANWESEFAPVDVCRTRTR